MIANVLLLASSLGLFSVFAIIAWWGSLYEPSSTVLFFEILGSAMIFTYACMNLIRQLRKERK